MNNDTEYAVKGASVSEQAEPSTANRAAGTVQMRILTELQVISYLLHRQSSVSEDLRELRQNFADSIS